MKLLERNPPQPGLWGTFIINLYAPLWRTSTHESREWRMGIPDLSFPLRGKVCCWQYSCSWGCLFFIPFTYIKDTGSIENITVEVYDEETDSSRYFELSAEQKEAVAQILLKMKCARSFGTGGPIQLRQFPISIDCMADGKSCHVLLGVKGKVYDGSGGLLSECRILNADVLVKELDALLL